MTLDLGTWRATLQPRDIDGDGTVDAYYDRALKITWLADMNAGAGSVYDGSAYSSSTDGQMSWAQARTWAAGLDVHGVTGWRLPTLLDTGSRGCDNAYAGTDCGYTVQTVSTDGATVFSELAHLYFVTLGNLATCPPVTYLPGDRACKGGPAPDSGLKNTGPFANLQAGSYWTGVPYVAPETGQAWQFLQATGFQAPTLTVFELHAVAVHDGDVAAAVVPEAPAMLLWAMGLAGIVGNTRRRVARG